MGGLLLAVTATLVLMNWNLPFSAAAPADSAPAGEVAWKFETGG